MRRVVLGEIVFRRIILSQFNPPTIPKNDQFCAYSNLTASVVSVLSRNSVFTLTYQSHQRSTRCFYASTGLTLPPDQGKQDFRTLYKAAYEKSWCVRIEEQYAHGKGVLVYLSRYLKGGPLHASQIVDCNKDQIEFRYKDHRDKRIKVLSLKPKEFVRRVLLHVAEQGQHMVRHYGLYAGAAKTKRALCRAQLGGLMESMEKKNENTTTPLRCRHCGSGLSLLWSVYPKRKKGNSYKVETDKQARTKWQVQQQDEPVIGRGKKKITALRL